MDEPEGNAETESQIECKKSCPDAPKPEGYEEPCYPGESIYDKIPKDDKAAIETNYSKSLGKADDKHSTLMDAAEDAKAKEKVTFDSAMRESDSAVKSRKRLVIFAKKDHYRTYKECLQKALPNTCRNIETDVPGDKKAICIAQLIQSMSTEDVEYLKAIQPICQKKADAERAWAKAKQQYDAAICNANAIRDQAVKDAQAKRRKELSAALQAVCSV